MRGALTSLAAVLALFVPAAAASGGTADSAPSRFLGVVPHMHVALPAPARALATPFTSTCGGSSCSDYANAINRYFTDVAAASGTTSNVYSTDTQYWDATGSIAYDSTFAGGYVDTNSYPTSGCNDGVDTVCLTDQQIQDELQKVLGAHGWHGSTTTMFFVMTPDGVGSCFDSSSTQCTTNVYCAYHSGFLDSNNEPVIYANEPFNATIPGCWDGTSPNGNDADATINTISHEHNEAITDPWGDAWYSAGGEENGDLCAWNFGATTGGTVGVDAYNQVINGDHYWLQQEWSNTDGTHGACVQQYSGTTASPATGDQLRLQTNPCTLASNCWVMRRITTYAIYWLPAPPTNSAPPVISGAAGVGKVLQSSTGSWTGSPTGYAYQWQRCAANGSGCIPIGGQTSATYLLNAADSGHTIRSSVSAHNSVGSSGYVTSAPSAVVVPLPAASGVPIVSGVAVVGKALSTTTGTWNASVSFAYHWQRCAADGSGCAAIANAAASTYPLVAADAGHRLKAVVSATNAAGTTTALSASSAVVIGIPHATGTPRISGKAKVGKRLRGIRGMWRGPPSTYKYVWLRCTAHGGKCVPIKRATHTTYRVTKHDAGHRLRLRVTAMNATGTGSAISRPTKRVPAARKH